MPTIWPKIIYTKNVGFRRIPVVELAKGLLFINKPMRHSVGVSESPCHLAMIVDTIRSHLGHARYREQLDVQQG
jgi:hypothetical protein